MRVMKPEAEPNGFIKTLNNMGYMTSVLDEYSKEFVRFSHTKSGPVLDIGAAYGLATQEALKGGAKVIANDIDDRHLQILWNEVTDEVRARLTLLSGDMSNLQIESESLSAVLVCRVLHFFSGEKIEQAAQKIYDWLGQGGRVYIVAETPYLRNFQNFIPIYESRKAERCLWPGFIEDVMKFAPDRGAFLPKQMHLLDSEVLRRVFERAGFRTLKCETMARKDFPIDIQWDGRESVGYIGEK